MKRTRNAVRNVIFGGLLKGYQILVPFIMRTLLIRYLGMEYLGLNSLFTSILISIPPPSAGGTNSNESVLTLYVVL